MTKCPTCGHETKKAPAEEDDPLRAFFRDLGRMATELSVKLHIPQVVPNESEELLTTKEAAVFLKMTPSAVRQAAWIGSLPVVRLGRLLRFRKSHLVATFRKGRT